MPNIEKTFVDAASIVPASWFNVLQKHLAGFMNLKVSILGDAVQVTAAAGGDDVASVYIGGEMRRNEATASHTFVAEASGTWNVYAVATAAVDTFAIEVSLTVPATSPYRKIAEVDWDLGTTSITALRGVRGRVVDHTHDGVRMPQVDHADLTGGSTGDPHTQYSLPAGTRAFTGAVAGVTPTGSTHLATKAYADAVLLTVPTGGVFWWPTADAAPAGFLLADGSAVSRTTYAKLFSVIGTAFGAGDGSTTFNVPDLRGRFVVGAADADDFAVAGSGSLSHTHTQATHTHSGDSHSHTTTGHTHTAATSGSAGTHDHDQGVTGSDATHTHTEDSHIHWSGSQYAWGTTGDSIDGSPHAGDTARGVFSQDDIDVVNSSDSHTHGAGSYVSGGNSLTGTSASGTSSHKHRSGNKSRRHTHTGGVITQATGSDGATVTGTQSATHTHTNPDVSVVSTHTHSSGVSNSAAPSTQAGGTETTAAGGADVSGSATYPYLSVNAIIRYL